MTNQPLGASLIDEPAVAPASADFLPIGVPSNPASLYTPTAITRVVDDDRAIQRLLEIIIERAGLTSQAAAERLGMDKRSLYPYIKGQRSPSLKWLLRLCRLCGAELQVKLPERPIR